MHDETVQIRSFRVVFDLERRIHRIDRFKVPLPYGLPLRSVGYAVAALAVVLVGSGLPLVGTVIGGLPAPIRLVLVPTAAAVALTGLRLDGRSAHTACIAWARYAAGPRNLVAFRPRQSAPSVQLGDVLTLPSDENRAEAAA